MLPPIRTDRITESDLSRICGDATVVVEVGANNGEDTRAFLRAMPKAHIYSFEPDERAIKKWRGFVRNARATLIEAAVGNVDGNMTFHLSDGKEDHPNFKDGWDMSGSLLEPTPLIKETFKWLKFQRTTEVKCMKLDTWFAASGLSHIDFIHVDIQGAEGDLVAGATTSLSKARWLFTEYSTTEYYKGQLTLDRLLEKLPEWTISERWQSDILLRNRSF